MDINHGFFDQIRCRTLNGSIYGHTFCLRTNPVVTVLNIGQIPSPVEKRRNIPFFSRTINHFLLVSNDALVPLIISADIIPGCLELNAQFFTELQGSHTIDDTKIYGLCNPPHFRSDSPIFRGQNLRRSTGMNILIPLEGIHKCLVLRIVGKHPEFYLAVVCRYKIVPIFGHKSLSNLPALFPSNGDILKIGIAAAQSSGCRNSLVIGRMDPSRGWIDHFYQCIEISGFKL